MQEQGSQSETTAQPQPSTFEPPSFSAPLSDFPSTPIPSPTGEMQGDTWRSSTMVNNDSGSGAGAVLPEELKGVNAGAFFLNWIWAINNKSWLGLLSLVPYIGFIMSLVLLYKGNEWAWQNRRWDSVQHFKDTQAVWGKWGWGIFIVSIVLVLISVLLPALVGQR